MHPHHISTIWQSLDRDSLAAIARKGPEPVFATISGAHLYGFASPDSDVDLRGAFLLPAAALLGLDPPAETITIEDVGAIELDWVAHDLRKFARLMTNHNGYVLEQLYSPLVVVETPIFEELKEIGKGCLTRPTVRHYRGFARGRVERLGEPGATVKHLLYAYRVLLTGIHLMRSGEVCSNISALLDAFPLPMVEELIQRKQQGTEKMLLEESELESHLKALRGLDDLLQEAHARSALPEEPTTVAALEDLVLRARFETWQEARG
ncbi:MAG: nucleotidyltransferase domain-containing protein [Deltaproteobacteria bacterium]|nr:nucleotidyltransferase domain-containing protein [Deltaproteobacteria bacterium]